MRKYHRMLCVFLILAFLLFPADRLPQAFAAETDADGAEPVVFYSALGRWLANLFGRDAA